MLTSDILILFKSEEIFKLSRNIIIILKKIHAFIDWKDYPEELYKPVRDIFWFKFDLIPDYGSFVIKFDLIPGNVLKNDTLGANLRDFSKRNPWHWLVLRA